MLRGPSSTRWSRCSPQGYSHADPFYQYLKDSFDALYAEGDPAGDDRPKMMSIGMHCRLLGRPGRITALQRFLDHIARHEHVWVCRRVDIARHWKQTHPFIACAPTDTPTQGA